MIPEGLKKNAVICILRHEKQFLLLKRLKEPNKDMYTPVGGKIDPYESPYDAAIRETFEETGIKVDKMLYCGSLIETSPTKYNWSSSVYLADIEMQSPPPCNEGGLKWIDFENVLDVPTPQTDWYIYQYVMNNKKFAFTAEFDKSLQMLNMEEELEGLVVFAK